MMGRRTPAWALLAAAAAAVSSIAVVASPATATTSSCGTNSNSGSAQQIGEYPAIQAAQSALHFVCSFTNAAAPASNEVSSKFTLHDFQNAQYHPGAARQLTSGAIAAGSKILTSTNAHFTAADVGHTVASVNADGTVKMVGVGSSAKPNIPANAFVASYQTANQVTLNIAIVTAVPAATLVKLDNSTARSVSDASVTSGCVVTSNTAFFMPSDTGKSIGGGGIPDYRTMTYNSPTQATASGAGCTAGSNQTINIGETQQVTTARQVGDATQSTSLITSATAKFAASDIGLAVAGTGIPANAYITAVAVSGANTTATVTPAMTANGTAHAITIGVASVTAPLSGSVVSDVGAALDLSPALVPGSNACALNKPEGFMIQGAWNNPGNFQTVADPGIALPVFGPAPTSGKIIAQLIFRTSAVDFSGFVMESPAAGDALKPVPHYDVTFPLLPTALGKCPAPNTVPVAINFHLTGAAQSQLRVPQGVGRPGSGQVRGLAPNPGGALVTTAVLKSDDATVPKNWSFTATCTMAATPVIDTHCGY
ncbi:MAG: hypothetical protein JWM05_2763 [Acidimicrobiales bacterium]|nr:hypothetical protein [Acidimicrobiales bacterium]